ncbi:DUF2844 domain-containing protein [Paraburkholderia piptadeniae]|uniref:DUF2844 domain-containing protein n=1 Tax=Paraburkholderia piptadeniae TaxID=1701573 RepID=UPI00117F0657|nr:DUF2844 domain-containing protein [Paraburkholderia piptadeniae]
MNLIRIASTATLLLPIVCHATLGAAPSADAHQASRSLRATPLPAPAVASAWSVHESQTADGVTIREYASPANGVRPMPPVCTGQNDLRGAPLTVWLMGYLLWEACMVTACYQPEALRDNQKKMGKSC